MICVPLALPAGKAGKMSNSSIFPYVPIAPRIKSTDPEKLGILTAFFELVDAAANQELNINHAPHVKGVLCIAPEQVGDLVSVLSIPPMDIAAIKQALESLTYPCFKGEYGIDSEVWKGRHVVVWEFQLNQNATEMVMPFKRDNNNLFPEELVGEALSLVRLWRCSVEGGSGSSNPDITYKASDLSNMLTEIELKLDRASSLME
jgi:hypothetical protein